MFRTVPLSITRSFSRSNGICHTGLLTAFEQAVSKPVRHCCVYSEILLMIERGTLRNM